ncbi:MAG: low temperature requirement protein A [Thiothrix sp.]|nr:low temperature requirement protein A [Thiothrix sp.]
MIKRLLTTPNTMQGRNVDESHRAATPLELFYDLVFVVAIGACASSLHHALAEHHYMDIITYLAIFLPMWWAWMNYTWFSSAFDNNDTHFRLLSMVQMFGALLMAAGMKGFFNGDPLLGLLGFVVMRFAMASLWFRAARDDPQYAATARRYAYGILIMQAVWIVWYLVTRDMGYVPRMLFLLVFMGGELLVPVLAERIRHTPWHPHHIAERYGLLTIIVLGEGIIGVSNLIINASSIDVQHALPVGFAGTVLIFALWWLYFKVPFAGALQDHNLRRGILFGYGHYLIFATLAAVGTGLELAADTFADTGAQGTSPVLAITTLAVAVTAYMLTLSVIRALVVSNGRNNLSACAAAVVLPGLAALTAVTHLLPLWLSLMILAIAPMVVIWLYGDQTVETVAAPH